jgi:hypothetical protein
MKMIEESILREREREREREMGMSSVNRENRLG